MNICAHPYAENFRAIFCLILRGELAEAEVCLEALVPESPAERRMRAHGEALLKYFRGDVAAALVHLEAARQAYGENASLLCDLMVCQYHAGRMADFRASLTRLEHVLIEHESRLSTPTLIRGEMMLGKFLEEEARLAPAMIYYERAFDRTLNRADPGDERLRVLMQKARWRALYEPHEELGELYRELISVDLEHTAREISIELQHNLMLIELRLIGAAHAWRRVERLGAGVAEVDRRLMIFDYVEGALAQDLPLGPAAEALIRAQTDLDPYEAYLRHLALETAAPRVGGLDMLAAKVSWSCYLRLLCLAVNREVEAPAREENERKIQLILQGLDPRSQSLWQTRLKKNLRSPEVRVEFSRRGRQLRVHGHVVDLAKKKIGMSLLENLVDHATLSVDRAIELLWQTTFSPEHYHRLRMSTHRLNTLIYARTGLGKVIEVDSQNVRLRPEVTLFCVDGDLN